MALTAAVINQAKPGDKRYMLKDENGLYLEISPTGKKLWRVRYWFQGKENRVGIGAYGLNFQFDIFHLGLEIFLGLFLLLELTGVEMLFG